jgi:ABC-type transport system involved in cytochrome bd biosynthesis fused ATPase/permease subunit
MFVETVEVISTGITSFEILEKSFPTFKKIYSKLRHGELQIAIFGAGGTGKTTLGRLLSGKFRYQYFTFTLSRIY